MSGLGYRPRRSLILPFHHRADIYAAIAASIGLTNNANAEKFCFLCTQKGITIDHGYYYEFIPRLSVTVTIGIDIVELLTLLYEGA